MMATSAMLTTSEVSSRKPMMSTSPSESRRVVSEDEHAAARRTRDDAPELVERRLHLGEDGGGAEEEGAGAQHGRQQAGLLDARLRTASSTASAACVPIRPSIWSEISPRAASSPNTDAAMVTRMMTRGAREKSV
jgi:hypothetical protein